MTLSNWEFAQREWLQEPPFGYTRVPGWLPAIVPGYVHQDLARQGIIAPPHEGMAELGCQWVDEADWCYRCRFTWGPGDGTILHFEGLDTVCSIFLNGELLAEHDNMFLPLQVDVASRLAQGGNELRVDFQSAARVGRERRARYFEEHAIADDVLNFDERAFVRKAQFMFGWDWGPRLVSCGIHGPVHLLAKAREWSTEQALPPVRLIRERDACGESFRFEAKGKPLWIRGANWIPAGSFGEQALRPLLEGAKAMGMNMLRVWGGGIYESEEFYDLCDELGILVWQDFPFACSYSPDDDDFLQKVREEATFHVRRLRRHRSLAIWCGNNENLTMWEGKWGGVDRQPSRFHGERIWNEVLAEVVAEHDPGRAYIPTSPIGSPSGIDDCNAGGYGDQHYWDVWHGRGDWIHYSDSTARFSSEFGFPSSCGARTWKDAAIVRRSPDSAEVRWHDKTGRPWSYWLELLAKHYPSPTTLEELIYYTGLNQRDAMRHAIEHYRRSEFCKGTLIWQLNDVWPAQSWSLVDSVGEWKAAAFELRRLYADRLLTLQVTDGIAHLDYINDGVEPEEDYVRLAAYDSLSGEELLRTDEVWFTVGPGERMPVLRQALTGLDPRQTILHAFSVGSETTRLLCEPKDLRLHNVPITLSMEDGELLATCASPLIDLFLDGRLQENFVSFRADSRYWFGNFGEVEPVMARSLAGVHEVRLA